MTYKKGIDAMNEQAKPQVPGTTILMKSDKPSLEKQVGGSHYKSLAIQPVEYCQKNKLSFCESSAIKYITRWRSKNGLEDIKKAIHFLEMLLEIEGEKNEDHS
jgi:hypothetical protein